MIQRMIRNGIPLTTVNRDITFNGNLSMGVGKVLTLAQGSLASPSLRAAGSDPGTGWSFATADQWIFGRAGVNQFQVNGSGTTFATAVATGTTTIGGTLTANGNTVINGSFRPAAATVSSDATLGTSSSVITITGGSTYTLPTTPLAMQNYLIHNRTAGVVTIARNGHTINSVAADFTIAAGASCWMSLYSGTTAGSWSAFEAPAA